VAGKRVVEGLSCRDHPSDAVKDLRFEALAAHRCSGCIG
jgi:hypothetical protein